MRRTLAIFILTLLPNAVFAQAVEEPELLWRQVLGGEALARPSVQLESVVVVCEGAALKAFGSSGTFLWEYKAGGKLLPFIARSGTGTSYICRTNGVLYAINRSGRRLWQVNLKEQMTAPPLIGWDDRVFVFLSKKLLCFTATGTQLWRLDTESPLAFAPVPDYSGGFAGVLKDGTFIRVSPFGRLTATPLAAVPFAVFPLASAAGDTGPVLALHTDGVLDFIGAGGKSLNEAPEGGLLPALPAPPLAAAERGGLLAVLLANGELNLVSPQSGVLWSVKTGLVKQDGTIEIYWDEYGIYILSGTGGEGYDLKGRRLWDMSLRGSAAVPVLDGRGVMYSCGKDWILYAYRVENEKLPQKFTAGYSLKAPGEYGLGKPPSKAAGFNGNTTLLESLLDIIEKSVKNGSLGEMEPEHTRLLLGLADSVNRNRQNTAFRLKALGILALIGSRETIPFLAELFHREQDARVKSAVAETIGSIGVDPEGLALDAFTEVIFPSTAYFQERLLFSITVSIGKLCRFSGPPLSGRGIQLLVGLSSYTQPKRVRRRAEQELSEIRTNLPVT
jgi:outer membrane protein assembly factor BamB